MEPEPTSCRLCIELELYLSAAKQPEASASGLSEAGKRNRAQQRKEALERAEVALARHKLAVHGIAKPEAASKEP